jgi:hypothetical protein
MRDTELVMNRRRNLPFARLSTYLIVTVLTAAALISLVAGVRIALADEMLMRKMLAPVTGLQLTPASNPDTAASTPSLHADVTLKTNRAAALARDIRRRWSTANTLMLGGIMVMCLAVLATSIPNLVAYLVAYLRGSEGNHGH